MFCTNCGNELTEGAQFCEKCGTSIVGNGTISADIFKNTVSSHAQKISDSFKNSGIIAMNDTEASQYDVSNNTQNLKDIFVEPDEQLLGKLGNGYLVNLLFKKTKKCNALLTDKRVYLKGTFYSSDTKNIFKTTEERILDLEDVTGTGFVYKQISKLMLVMFILSVLSSFVSLIFTLVNSYDAELFLCFFAGCALLAVLFFLVMIKSRKAFFFIDYAGGRIKIDAKLIGLSDVQDFHKQMRRAKDSITGKK